MALIQDDKIIGINSALGNQNEEDVYFNFINSLKSEVTKKDYESEKWLMITFASVTICLTIGLVSLAYGANSLEELKNEVENPRVDTYRQELINYITEHNVTLYDFPISNFNNTALELFVQADMMRCHDSIENGIPPLDPRCAQVLTSIADFMNNK